MNERQRRRVPPMLCLKVRVNGIPIKSLNVRRCFRGGLPTNRLELVIEDPAIGTFAIHEGFEVEIKRVSRDEKSAPDTWQRVTPEQLISLLRGRSLA